MIVLLSNPFVLAMIAGFTVGAAVVAAILVRMMAEAKDAARGGRRPGAAPKSSNRRMDDAFEGSPMVRRAIELTANLAERKGVLGSVERSLRAADIPLRPAEVIFAYVLLATIVPISVLLLLQKPMTFLLSILVFVVLPPFALKTVVKMRRKKFVEAAS